VGHKDKPLYTFIKDKKAGETTGNGLLNGAWHVAKP
jgi:predicted lipoprotein with Yx(FWY)xxD motif